MDDTTLIVGVDHGRDDRTAVAIMERMRDKLVMRDVVFLKARSMGMSRLARLVADAMRKGALMRCGRKSQRSTLRRLRFERNKAKRLCQARTKRAGRRGPFAAWVQPPFFEFGPNSVYKENAPP